jgi:hypothetical protein
VINVGGVVFYKDINQIKWELITATSIIAARQLLPYLVLSVADLEPVFARIGLIIADTAAARAVDAVPW